MIGEPEHSARFLPPLILTTYLPEIQLNIILPSPSRSSSWTFPKRFPAKILGTFLAGKPLVKSSLDEQFFVTDYNWQKRGSGAYSYM
jgi:hypothetical protein